MSPTLGPTGADRTQVGLMLAHEPCYLGWLTGDVEMILHTASFYCKSCRIKYSIFRKHVNIYAFYIVSQLWYGVGSWSGSLSKIKTEHHTQSKAWLMVIWWQKDACHQQQWYSHSLKVIYPGWISEGLTMKRHRQKTRCTITQKTNI